MGRVAGVLGVLGSLVVGPSSAQADDRAAEELSVLGRTELVRVVAPDTGKSEQGLARIDTGAVRSSIDSDLARDLGLDLDDADEVTVRSSLGREERPLVPVTLQIGERTIRTRVTVNDRSRLSSPILIGRHDLDGFLVDVTETRLTAPGADTSAPASLTALGRKEKVRVVAPGTRNSAEEFARIDTGAARSSIDSDLARDLGLDLDDAERITVKSSLGREERPLVRVTLQIGERTIRTRVTVTDRSRLSSPILIGRDDLDGFLVDVSTTHLTRPGVDPSARRS